MKGKSSPTSSSNPRMTAIPLWDKLLNFLSRRNGWSWTRHSRRSTWCKSSKKKKIKGPRTGWSGRWIQASRDGSLRMLIVGSPGDMAREIRDPTNQIWGLIRFLSTLTFPSRSSKCSTRRWCLYPITCRSILTKLTNRWLRLSSNLLCTRALCAVLKDSHSLSSPLPKMPGKSSKQASMTSSQAKSISHSTLPGSPNCSDTSFQYTPRLWFHLARAKPSMPLSTQR